MRLQRFVLAEGYLVTVLQERDRRIVYAIRLAVDRCFSAAKLV